MVSDPKSQFPLYRACLRESDKVSLIMSALISDEGIITSGCKAVLLTRYKGYKITKMTVLLQINECHR